MWTNSSGPQRMELAFGVELPCGFRVQTMVKFHTLPVSFSRIHRAWQTLFVFNESRPWLFLWCHSIFIITDIHVYIFTYCYWWFWSAIHLPRKYWKYRFFYSLSRGHHPHEQSLFRLAASPGAGSLINLQMLMRMLVPSTGSLLSSPGSPQVLGLSLVFT